MILLLCRKLMPSAVSSAMRTRMAYGNSTGGGALGSRGPATCPRQNKVKGVASGRVRGKEGARKGGRNKVQGVASGRVRGQGREGGAGRRVKVHGVGAWWTGAHPPRAATQYTRVLEYLSRYGIR